MRQHVYFALYATFQVPLFSVNEEIFKEVGKIQNIMLNIV